MKAILIDPKKREVRGIGVEYTTLSEAFFDGPNAKIALTMTDLGARFKSMLVTNAHGKPFQGKSFGLIGSGLSPVFGRGLLIGYERDGKGFRSTVLTVREVEQLVRFI